MSDIEVTPDMRETTSSNTREWDGDDAIDAFPEARESAKVALAKEYADQVNAQAEPAEGDEDGQETSTEEESSSDSSDDALSLVEEGGEERGSDGDEGDEDEEQEEVIATPRAEKRIQKLVAEKNELRSVVEKLAAAELARQQAEAHRQQQEALQRQYQEAEYKKQQRLRMAAEAGYDPTDPRTEFMLLVSEKNIELENKLAQIEAHVQQQKQLEENQRAWAEYNANMERSFETILAGRKLPPEIRADLEKAVTGLATLNGSRDPIEEVRQVLRPYMKTLKAAAPAPAAQPKVAENPAAHRAVALKGPAGTKKAGEKAGSAKPGKISLDQASAALWGSAKTAWDR